MNCLKCNVELTHNNKCDFTDKQHCYLHCNCRKPIRPINFGMPEK